MVRAGVHRVIAAVALMVLAPLLLLIALAVRSTSRGPVFFKQLRVGQYGSGFEVYKFRTMVVGADRMSANISPDGDPRVTRVGRLLRSSYLDELPQLWNVVKGDMNLVGPRPETPEYVALYTEDERRVLEVRPGLAGPSTLGFMDEGDRLAGVDDPAAHYESVLVHERVQMDLACLDRCSLTHDVRLLCRQVLAILRHLAGAIAYVTPLRGWSHQ
jgi:lipopolysaccharide/colanic/teichoic acid biosynthesis glycosyltransferase